MLTIYRASAGAGKTYKLTGEYLKLLFSAPGAFRRILAVTFTNKATDEMKGRIIEELHRLATGKDSSYVVFLSQLYALSEEQIRQTALHILTEILHDYSAFNISTIDRFFQQTMRAFVREIGMQGGYAIEMDQSLVLTEAVDALFAGLEKPENNDLLGWMLRFAEDKIESGGEWNLRKDILKLGNEVFRENYKQFAGQLVTDLADKKTLEAYRDSLYGIVRAEEKAAKELGERGISILDRYNLTAADLKNGRWIVSQFERLADGEMKEPSATFISVADNVEVLYKKTTPAETRQSIIEAFSNGLNDCVKAVVSFFGNLTAYYTAKEIVRYYYTLGILTDISREIAVYREEKNVMLIADTTELLNKVIDGSDAPFIYEKTGTRIDHYMIDEFQDTSGMQWHNFKPLITESLAHNRQNLIVGDVKQSIYRFRNSDWKLLDEQLQTDFSQDAFREETLGENWRSCRHIVAFNNSFFFVASKLLQTYYNKLLDTSTLTDVQRRKYISRIETAYAGNVQQVAPPFMERAGHVRIDFLEKEIGDDWKMMALERLPETLERLQDNGYALKEIALLVRTNGEAVQVADRLLSYRENHPSEKYRYDILSDEALLVGSSQAVRFLIALLRLLNNPEDPTCRQLAFFSYQVLTGTFGSGAERFFSETTFEILERLSRQSVYEITEALLRLFAADFPENEQVFLQAFLDMVVEYTRQESADLGRFLKWWDDNGLKKTITSPEGQDAVRILTIHKSKGLGFKVVILPFCDWGIDHHANHPPILWCHPTERPFDRLQLVPVRYGQSLGKTIFADDYFEERLQAFIDNLNTLYVAFTRAKEELIVFAPRPTIGETGGLTEKMSSVSELLWNGLQKETEPGSLQDMACLPDAFDPENGYFELGEWWHPAGEKQKDSTPEIRLGRLGSISPSDRLSLRLHGRDFAFDDRQRKHGMLMHELLSTIRLREDLAAAVDAYLLSGVIGQEEASDIFARLETVLKKPEVAPWYDASAEILNEREILCGKKTVKRPDRVIITGNKAVVIDYKFGEHSDSRYHSQVKNYMKLIREMGYEEVKGFLWYVELDKIEAVEG